MPNDLSARLRKRAEEDQKCADNSAATAALLQPEYEKWERREAPCNIYTVRLAIDHQKSAKRDADYAADLRAAADLIDQQAAEIAGYRNDLVSWPLGTRVRKRSDSSWQGRVVGFYATSLTPVGYCVESEREPGSVQIYPEAALELAP